MRFGFVAVVAAAAALSVLAAPVSAQTAKKKRVIARNYDHTVSVTRDEDGRTRTRIIVQHRSYLDAGTNVTPGQRKYTDYVIGPTSYSANPSTDHTAFGIDSQIRPGPFDLPGSRNPMQW